MEPNQLQWKVWIVPNYNKTNSLLIWKSQHVIADGIGVMCMLNMLNDSYDPKDYI
jgi:NRPS condensation-like uncharacterized protein